MVVWRKCKHLSSWLSVWIPQAERNILRALLKQEDLKPHHQILSAMAGQPYAIEYGPSTAVLLARTLDIAGDGKRAIAVLGAAVVRYPDDPWTNFELATFLIKADPPQTDESIRFYTAARALRPESGLDMAQILEGQGRDNEVEMLLHDLVRRNPRRFLFLFNFFRVLCKRGKMDEARSIAERMTGLFLYSLERAPGNARAAKDLAALLRVIGDPFVSIAALREALRILPNEPALHFELAEALGRTGDRDGEIAELRKAIRIESGRRDELKQAIAVNAKVAAPSGPKNQVAEALGVKEGMEPVDEVREVEVDNAFFQGFIQGSGKGLPQDIRRGHLALGIALAETGDPREAITAYKEAIRLDEISNLASKAVLYGSLGSTRRLTGDLTGAIAAYREAIRLGVVDPEWTIESRYGLAMALVESGDVPSAINEFRAAIRQEALGRVAPDHLLEPIMPPTPQTERLDRVVADRLLQGIFLAQRSENVIGGASPPWGKGEQ